MNKGLKLILIAAAVFYISFILRTSFVIKDERYFTLIDDAMISMRYAHHLAQGHGLVWNIGEKPVQGFTNPGWTLLMAFFHLFPFPISKISLTVMLSAGIILLVNTAVVFRITERLLPGLIHAPLVAATITAFYFPLVFWSLRGMEVGLLVLLMDYAILLSLTSNKSIFIGAVLALAIIVRLDALPSAVLICIYFLIKHRSRKSFLPILLIAATTLAVLLFQKAYFGDFLPTTYYQKISGYTTFDRLRHGLLVFNEFATRDVLMLLVFSIAGLLFYRQGRDRETQLLLGVFLIQCAYSIYVGGDYAEPETNSANRFITQGMPALFILFGLMTSRFVSDLQTVHPKSILSNPKANPDILIAIMILIIISGEPWINYTVDNAPLLKADIRRVRLGLHIAGNTSPEAVIAVHAAGQIPYFSERTTIDLLGLNDPAVAKGPGNGEFYPGHNKWNYDYSIGLLKPDLIADNFADFSAYIHGNDQYKKLNSDIYVRLDSPFINTRGLDENFR